MFPISIDKVAIYLAGLAGGPVRILSVSTHPAQELEGDLKGFGYGTPVFITYEAAGEQRKVVLETMTPSSFGHEHFSDRAQAILWEYRAFNDLPRHVRALDAGAFLRSGDLLSTGAAEEFFILTEFAEGQGYFHDLDRMQHSGIAEQLDHERADALADYLCGIHARRHLSPALYRRRVRELLGHGECVMGLIDNYPDRFEFIDRELLRTVERACLEWRWRIRDRAHRLCCVHGDFHPWNILFRDGTDFSVLDRSRGEWGDPADDVTSLTINYLFSSLLRSGRFEDPFASLFERFWDRYLERSGDRELAEVAAPFYAWRGLVIASPVWYPHLPPVVRRSVFAFIRNVLAADRFDHRAVRSYLE